MKKSYEKKFNVLIHGIPETRKNVREALIQALGLIHNFMKEGLEISDQTANHVVDYHRLTTRPLYALGLTHNFMKEGLEISDQTANQVVDYHRLTIRPLYVNENQVNRPIIFKFTKATNKRHTFNKVKNLKSYIQ